MSIPPIEERVGRWRIVAAVNGRSKVGVYAYSDADPSTPAFADDVNLTSDEARSSLLARFPDEDRQVVTPALMRLAAGVTAARIKAHHDAPPSQGTAIAFADIEPWGEPVDGAELLADMETALLRYLVLPDGASVAVPLWIMHAHAHDAAPASAILTATSPEKRCGKTRLLILVGELVPRPLAASNITPAALFRCIDRFHPTLLIDEADTFLDARQELRGILNDGWIKARAKVMRTVGDDHEPRLFNVWSPKALAAIGNIPDSLADRSIVVRMRRRAPGEPVERLRMDHLGEQLASLRRRAARWARDNFDRLKAADPAVPEQLNDRAAENYRPLLAIADAAGGDWGARARRAALVLSGHAITDDTPAIVLLADIRELIREGVDHLESAVIVNSLITREDRPWPEWSHGRPLSARGLARLLKRFGIEPRLVRDGSRVFRGYKTGDFADAFARYLPAASVTAVTAASPGDLAAPSSVTASGAVTHEESRKVVERSDVTRVTGTEDSPLERDGVLHYPDGSQALTPERIHEIQMQRRAARRVDGRDASEGQDG